MIYQFNCPCRDCLATILRTKDTLITRRAEFHGLRPWVNENSPMVRQAKLIFEKRHGLCPWVSTWDFQFHRIRHVGA